MRFSILFIFIVFNLTLTSQAINPRYNTSLFYKKPVNGLHKRASKPNTSNIHPPVTKAYVDKLSRLATLAEKDFGRLHKSGGLDLTIADKNSNILKNLVLETSKKIMPTGMFDSENPTELEAFNMLNRLNRLQNQYESVAKELNWNTKNKKGFTKLPADMSIDALVAAGNNLPELKKNGSYQTGSKDRLYRTVFLNNNVSNKDKEYVKKMAIDRGAKTYAPYYYSLEANGKNEIFDLHNPHLN